jgi:hypothetical protein
MPQVWLGNDGKSVISDVLPKHVDAAWEGFNITVWRLLSMATICGR